jgi:hypothetical protein
MKFNSNQPYINEIQNCTSAGPGLVQRGDNYKMQIVCKHLKIFFSRSTRPGKLKFT